MDLPDPDPKSRARGRLREALGRLSPADAARDSLLLCQRLRVQPEWEAARTVLLYRPIAGEPDVWPLVEEALRAGKAVALPRREAATDTYRAARILDPEVDLRPGRFGIPEPRAECPECPLNRLDFVLVPGIGFTLDGGRLGRGKGYFDRLLSAVAGFRCGVAFECQVVPELPLEPHDARLDCILTPTRWHLTTGRARS